MLVLDIKQQRVPLVCTTRKPHYRLSLTLMLNRADRNFVVPPSTTTASWCSIDLISPLQPDLAALSWYAALRPEVHLGCGDSSQCIRSRPVQGDSSSKQVTVDSVAGSVRQLANREGGALIYDFVNHSAYPQYAIRTTCVSGHTQAQQVA